MSYIKVKLEKDNRNTMKIGKYSVTTVPVKNVNLKGLAKNVYTCPIDLNFCPKCRKKLKSDYTMAIRVSETDCVKVKGKYCSGSFCDSFFTKKDFLFSQLEKYRYDKKAYTLYQPYNYKPINSKNYFDLKSFYCKVSLCDTNNIREYVILTSWKDVRHYSLDNVIHYSDPIALSLLTSIKLGEDEVEVDNEILYIQSVYYKRIGETDEFSFVSPNTCVEIKVKKSGGYYTPDKNFTILDGLVFCEKSKKLEILRMSYDKKYNLYFVDRNIYEEFLARYGIPIIKYASSKRNGFFELKEESLLHTLGYNVGESSNLSDKERHLMLGKFVDLGFTTVPSIINLLKSLIKRNGVRSPKAKMKWIMDLDFIKDYKANPETFAFVEKIRNC